MTVLPTAASAPGTRPVALLGPTATGKSDLALALGRHLPVEVVNADAMQLYRGMDVGTAKLPPADRAGVPHHLLDVLDVTETASVAAYQRAARAAVPAPPARATSPGSPMPTTNSTASSRNCWDGDPTSSCCSWSGPARRRSSSWTCRARPSG